MQQSTNNDAPTPRVNKGLLRQYIGSDVRLVGEVRDQQKGKLTLRTSDDGEVLVVVSPSVEFSAGTVVEIVGTVNQDLSVREKSSVAFQSAQPFDLKNYEQLLQFTQVFPELFFP